MGGKEMEEEVMKDMTPRLVLDLGMRYPTEKSSRKYRYGLFECQYCKKEFEAVFNNVKTGCTKSCGCQKNKQKITHGLKSNRFYKTWCQMVYRCNNPKNKDYKNYGARGITVCEEWLDVTNFVAWAELTHPNIEGVSLDRIDNDKGYSPENCRWADKTTQAYNKRMQKSNTSGFVGVSYYDNIKKWRAKITVNKILKHIGLFLTIEEAVQARDNYIIENNLSHKLSTDYVKEQINE